MPDCTAIDAKATMAPAVEPYACRCDSSCRSVSPRSRCRSMEIPPLTPEDVSSPSTSASGRLADPLPRAAPRSAGELSRRLARETLPIAVMPRPAMTGRRPAGPAVASVPSGSMADGSRVNQSPRHHPKPYGQWRCTRRSTAAARYWANYPYRGVRQGRPLAMRENFTSYYTFRAYVRLADQGQASGPATGS